MSKFAGNVGYTSGYSIVDGVATEQMVVRHYYGEVMKNSRRLTNGESINDDVTLGNSFSIVADAYAYQNYSGIRYVEWMGTKWKVDSVEVERPRLILSCGGVWNGQT